MCSVKSKKHTERKKISQDEEVDKLSDFQEDLRSSSNFILKQNPSLISVLLVLMDTTVTNESHLQSATSCGWEHESPINLLPHRETTVMWSDWKIFSFQAEMESEMECFECSPTLWICSMYKLSFKITLKLEAFRNLLSCRAQWLWVLKLQLFWASRV